MIVIEGMQQLRGAIGVSLGTSEWLTVSHDLVERFASCTGCGSRVATGDGVAVANQLVLCLGPRFSYSLYELRDLGLVLNYGFDAVEFRDSPRIGDRVRMSAELASVDVVKRGVAVRVSERFEIERTRSMACHAIKILHLSG